MTGFFLGLAIGIGGGGTLIWFGKERIQALVVDVNTISANLHAKADKLLKK